eukprot:gene7253-1295_t
MPKKSVEKPRWACSRCTYLNDPAVNVCSMCGPDKMNEGDFISQRIGSPASSLHVSSTEGAEQPFSSNTTRPTVLTPVQEVNSFVMRKIKQINEFYAQYLNRPSPFLRYILLGNQSSGKSTMVERILGFPMNSVAEGTGTRCPLYVTCQHDPAQVVPACFLSGCSTCTGGDEDVLPVPHQEVFTRITKHSRDHVGDGFTEKPLRLQVVSKNVQNMLFVDLPGIGQGDDRRNIIREILKAEMDKPNTMMLVLLEPKEYSTNNIIDFVDEVYGGRRGDWVHKALWVLNKFDLRIVDSQTAKKSNANLEEYWINGIRPYMAFTPSYNPVGGESTEEEYLKRQKLIHEADARESAVFHEWMATMEHNAKTTTSDHPITFDLRYSGYCKFASLLSVMHTRLLQNAQERLPEVIQQLRRELETSRHALADTERIAKLMAPNAYRIHVAGIMNTLKKRVLQYLDGSLAVMKKIDCAGKTLREELGGEEHSEWFSRRLNHFTEAESDFRQRASQVSIPDAFYPDSRLLGGKQYQRALQCFTYTLVQLLPDPHELKEYVASATGALRDNLAREDWDHACVEVIKDCVTRYTHPGINVLCKHLAHIFQQLLPTALQDLATGEIGSADLKLLPPGVLCWIEDAFNSLVRDVVLSASAKCHEQLAPMYSTVMPSLPTMLLNDILKEQDHGGECQSVQQEEHRQKVDSDGKSLAWVAFRSTVTSLLGPMDGDDAASAKKKMSSRLTANTLQRTEFLPSKRSAMITDKEIDTVLNRAFDYIMALTEFNNTVLSSSASVPLLHIVTLLCMLTWILFHGCASSLPSQRPIQPLTTNLTKVMRFSVNHHVFLEFKKRLDDTFGYKLANEMPS